MSNALKKHGRGGNYRTFTRTFQKSATCMYHVCITMPEHQIWHGINYVKVWRETTGVHSIHDNDTSISWISKFDGIACCYMHEVVFSWPCMLVYLYIYYTHTWDIYEYSVFVILHAHTYITHIWGFFWWLCMWIHTWCMWCEDEIRHNIHVEMLLYVETYMIYVWWYDNCMLIHTEYMYEDLVIGHWYINGTWVEIWGTTYESCICQYTRPNFLYTCIRYML